MRKLCITAPLYGLFYKLVFTTLNNIQPGQPTKTHVDALAFLKRYFLVSKTPPIYHAWRLFDCAHQEICLEIKAKFANSVEHVLAVLSDASALLPISSPSSPFAIPDLSPTPQR